ncbi:MAG: DHH family phosphoesterase [Candidatus Eiseniibacteriota bacterium]
MTGGVQGEVHPVVLRIWLARLGSVEAAARFFRADPDDVGPPSTLPGLARAADRIAAAVRGGERITVFGHDDPDGITSCAVMVETLEALGAAPRPYIPDRNVEGHGLYDDLVRSFASAGTKLLVTTDGCSTNAAEAGLARSLGMDVVVTDHHVIAEGRAAVPGLVNPMADPAAAKRLGDLTGAGVAWLLAKELFARAKRPRADAEKLLDLVALGTIADHGDVSRSNRPLVVQGLAACAVGRRPAVAEAARRAAVADPFAEIEARRLAAVFAAIPSVRGESRGLSALLGRDAWREDVAALAEAEARTRRELDEAVRSARAAARQAGVYAGAPAVLRIEAAAGRALGAVATALSADTQRPAAALVQQNGAVIGELRAPDGVHLVEVLGGMRELFESWGGHRRAAGFSAAAAKFAEIERRLAAALDVPAAPEPPREPEAKVWAADVDDHLLGSLAAARPFSRGNPEPVLAVDGEPRGAEELLAHGTAK